MARWYPPERNSININALNARIRVGIGGGVKPAHNGTVGEGSAGISSYGYAAACATPSGWWNEEETLTDTRRGRRKKVRNRASRSATIDPSLSPAANAARNALRAFCHSARRTYNRDLADDIISTVLIYLRANDISQWCSFHGIIRSIESY